MAIFNYSLLEMVNNSCLPRDLASETGEARKDLEKDKRSNFRSLNKAALKATGQYYESSVGSPQNRV
jgi:hypothetical protein